MKLIDFADELPISADPANLPPNQIVTAKQLEMRPGQKLQDKAKELGCSRLTLRIWHAKWEGSNVSSGVKVLEKQRFENAPADLSDLSGLWSTPSGSRIPPCSPP